MSLDGVPFSKYNRTQPLVNAADNELPDITAGMESLWKETLDTSTPGANM